MKPINVGLLGIGTVGGGTFTVLTRNEEEITRRAGRPILITWWRTRIWSMPKGHQGRRAAVTDDAFAVVNDPEMDIVVELIGGCGVAKELVLKAIAQRQACGHRQQGAAGQAWQRDFRRGAKEGRDGGVRSRRGRRHSHHQGAARRADRQPHRMDRRHHQRHHQLHPVRDARQGAGLRRRAEGGAALGLRRSRSDFRHRRRRCRAQDHHLVRDRVSASRCSSTRRISRASPGCRRWTSGMPSNWATASSCWASPAAQTKGIELRVHPTLIPAKRLIANVEGAMNAVLVQARCGRLHAVLRQGRRR